MFWHAVGSGLLALFDWHILLGLAGMGMLTFGYHAVTAGLWGGGQSGGRAGAAVGWQMFGGPLVMIVAIAGFITLCLPAILGVGGFTPAGVVGETWIGMLAASGLAFLITIAIGFIPVVGSVVAYTPGASTYIMGAIVLQMVVQSGYQALSRNPMAAAGIAPSIWQAIGFLAIGAVIGLLIIVLSSGAAESALYDRHRLSQYGASGNTPESKLVAMVLNPLVGVLPLLMYGRYLGASFERLL